ncbi:MarR family winged helix-turn-helix transcriptional regulator [Actinomadura roseirufa]|uniref:MarR family winged helix-turn-helix transcriptional regulator n=1 Tax=Actinomadura roseirufa TaxID=2094049 RepID=UPI00104173F6|nr:MarR family transcriptional regulator [Actinomadura roseirufa]
MPDLPLDDELESWHTGRLLAAAARLVEHAFDAGVADLGVTHAGVNVLHELAQGALTQRQLAHRCGVQDQTMSRTLDGLERAALVVRHRDTADRRRVLVERTAEGALVMEHAQAVAASRLASLADDSCPEHAAGRRLLIKIIQEYGTPRRIPRRPGE